MLAIEVTGLELVLRASRGVGPAVSDALRAAFLREVAASPYARRRARAVLLEAGARLDHLDELTALRRALDAGALVLEARAPRPPLALPALPEQEVEPLPAPEPVEHDWVEIELADEDGAPVQGATFELTLPGGRVRQGRTDHRGRFVVPRTDAGRCQLRWLRLHPVERALCFAGDTAAVGSAAGDTA